MPPAFNTTQGLVSSEIKLKVLSSYHGLMVKFWAQVSEAPDHWLTKY